MPVVELKDAPKDYTGDAPKQYPLIPENTTLDAVITEIKEDVKPFKDRETGQPVVKLAWTFQTNYEGQDRKVWGETGNEFVVHPDCLLYSWSQEAVGQDLPVGFNLDTDRLIGSKVRITMGVRSYVKKGDTEENRKYVNFVADVMRSKEAMAASIGAPAASAPAQGYSEEDPF